jgi:uncharacterized protein (DUF488 family)
MRGAGEARRPAYDPAVPSRSPDQPLPEPVARADRGPERTVWTIGHSRHPWDRFVELLEAHEIALLADVRSLPLSRFSPHFHRDRMQAGLAAVGIGYEWLGAGLGGRPKGAEFYDAEGRVAYDRIAAGSTFRGGIERLMALAGRQRVAMMCAEEDPNACHRRLLVTPALLAAGLKVLHIRKDGAAHPEEYLSGRGHSRGRGGPTLFDE